MDEKSTNSKGAVIDYDRVGVEGGSILEIS